MDLARKVNIDMVGHIYELFRFPLDFREHPRQHAPNPLQYVHIQRKSESPKMTKILKFQELFGSTIEGNDLGRISKHIKNDTQTEGVGRPGGPRSISVRTWECFPLDFREHPRQHAPNPL